MDKSNSNKISRHLKNRLTADLGIAFSNMSFLGQYENAVNIIIDHIVQFGSRIDTVSHPLLYLMRHSIELGYKANLEHLKKYSQLPLPAKPHHDLKLLHEDFEKHVNKIIALLKVDKESADEFHSHLQIAQQVIDQLGPEQPSSFRYPTDTKKNLIFTSHDKTDILQLKAQYDQAISMLVYTADLLSPYTDYADFLEKVPDFEIGLGKVLMTFPTSQLNHMMEKISEHFEKIGIGNWRDKKGTRYTILIIDQLCYFMPIKLNIRTKLKEYIPSLFSVLKDDKISWSKINKLFDVNFNLRKAKMEPGQENMEVDASFYDIVSGCLTGNQAAKRLFTFFDNLLQELAINVPDDLKEHLKTPIFNILTNFDKNYLNFIGELAVLNQLLKSGNFELRRTAFPLPNGQDIDLQMFDKTKQETVLIEVVNIHIKGGFDKVEDIILCVNSKMSKKVQTKNKDLNGQVHYLLATVIWAPINELEQIGILFRSGFKPEYENIIEPLAYATFYNEEITIPKFGTITTLFEQNT